MLPLDPPLLPGGFKFSIPFFEIVFVPAVQSVRRRGVVDGVAEPDSDVVHEVLCHKSPDIIMGKRRPRSDAISFERLMMAFQFTVRLRVRSRCTYVNHPSRPDEVLKVPGDKLQPVVGDNLRTCFRILLLNTT